MTVALREESPVHSTDMVVAGVCICISTNSERVLENFAAGLDTTPHASSSLSLHIQVTDELGETEMQPYFRGLQHLVFMSFGSSCFVLDLHRHTVNATVTKQFAADPKVWNERIIPITLGVLGPTVGLVPLHAACLEWRGRGLLLAGLSGAGKSTLAIALAKLGLPIISDDWTYVSSSGEGLTCHGVNAPVKLLPDAASHFPELQRMTPQTSLNGELAYEVDPAHTFGVSTNTRCIPEWIVILERAPAATCLRSLPGEVIRSFFVDNAERLPAELRTLESIRQSVISRVASLAAWKYSYAGNPNEGAERLVSLLEDQ